MKRIIKNAITDDQLKILQDNTLTILEYCKTNNEDIKTATNLECVACGAFAEYCAFYYKHASSHIKTKRHQTNVAKFNQRRNEVLDRRKVEKMYEEIMKEKSN